MTSIKNFTSNTLTIKIGEHYSNVDQSTVDGEQWYTVKCSTGILLWVKTHPQNMWHEHIDSNWYFDKTVLDVHEKIYTMLQLKYGDGRV